MSLVSNERIKLSASDQNKAAGGLFTAGVVAPLVAVVFGITGSANSANALTRVVGITIFLRASGALHIAARRVLTGLKP